MRNAFSRFNTYQILREKEIFFRLRGYWLVLVAILLCSIPTRALAQAEEKPLLPLKVVGTQLVDSQNRKVSLHGVNMPSLEWSSNGEGHILTSVKVALSDWHVNIIRLPLSQDRWFGKGPDQQDGGVVYRDLVKQIVDLCAASGCYVILDLHWSDANEWGQQIGQHFMPDQNSMVFWKSVAIVYENHPAILFDLYNEPHDVTWEIWRDGGMVTEKNAKTGDKTYQAVGLQELLDVLRKQGAKNVIIAGGLKYASDFTGILDGKRLADPDGNGVVYADHVYPFVGEDIPTWTARMEKVAGKLPLFIGEFGSDPGGGQGKTGGQWVYDMLQVMKQHDWNWAAWDFHPAASPCLIKSFDYTPTAHFGVYVQQALLGKLTAYIPAPPVIIGDGIFADTLQNGWQNYGWAKLDYNNMTTVHTGKVAIKVEAAGFQAIFLHHDPFDTREFSALTFWIHGGPQGGQRLKVEAMVGGKPQKAYLLPMLRANTWQHIEIPLLSLGVQNRPNMEGFWIQDTTGTKLPVFYVDDILFKRLQDRVTQ